ncbi:AMP-binding protein [Paraburkholderia pallida]|uniref:AMP-dependent synthetase n=1 Tax=Paraburkholderia pallida TaxID=2547399 RepID=A0A4P7D5N8_9BURK|nr:AMP-binding protein [Paraburkholderia pallida]QBR03398.1 AMP-dependent synthetase [Paraburkholderia pallida]
MEHAASQNLAYWPADQSEPFLEISIGDALTNAAERWENEVALVEGVSRTDRRRWTYGELLTQSRRVAGALLSRFRPGEHVAVWASNSPEWVQIELGAALAGITLVTVNPAYLASELKYVLKQSQTCGIIVEPEYRGRKLAAVVEEVKPELPLLREIISLESWGDFVNSSSESATLPRVEPGAIAQIQYTSGTTGFPKGALLTHRGLANNGRIYAQVIGARKGDVWVNPMPLFHTAGCGLVTLGALQTGGTHVLPPAFDPALMLELIQSERGTLMSAVPTMIVRILDHPELASFDLSSWRLATLGGAPVPPALVQRIENTLRIKAGIGFGQTEASPYITHTRENESRTGWALTVGRPMPQVEVKVANPQSGETVPFGTVGEIWTRGSCVTKGYFDNAEATRQALTGDGWLRTGDLGSMASDGYLTIQGRMKEMIIRGGENVYPREIEEVLLSHPAVVAACVVGLPDAEWGEIIAAFVQLKAGRAEGESELTSFCRTRLASYKTPRVWRFVDQFPQTASGKVQKYVLREQLLKEARTDKSLDGGS